MCDIEILELVIEIAGMQDGTFEIVDIIVIKNFLDAIFDFLLPLLRSSGSEIVQW